jgi:TonB family protein
MISLLVLVKLTLVLALGSAAFLMSSRVSAAARHLLCVLTLAFALLLPLTSQLPAFGKSHAFYFIVDTSTAVAAEHPATLHWLPVLWIAGALAVFLRFALGALYLVWRTRGSISAVDDPSMRGVRVRFAAVTTPIISGWIRPTVLVPFSFAEWTQEHKYLAIAHEVAHIKRADNWIVLVSAMARSIYWFHPLVWWLTAKLEEQQEFACDDRVLATGASSSEYASLLVDVARQLSSPALFGCAIIPNKSNLRGRIMHILNFQDSPQSSRWNRLAVASGLSALLLASILIPARAEKTPDKQKTVYKIGGDVLAPRVLYKVEPQYSKEASRDKIQGVVILGVVIDTDGLAKDIQVKKHLDIGLDQKAVEAVTQWRFQPATKSGEPVPVQATIEVNFRLK